MSRRALGRATLARQLLLERADLDPVAAVQRLVGLQAQAPWAPYYQLLSRLERFAPDDLGQLLVDRTLVRAVTMRGTIHLMTVPDAFAIRPLVTPVLERGLTAQKERREALAGADLDAITAAGRPLVAAEALTPKELGARLAEQFPGVDPAALATVVRDRVPTVQTTPRAVWGKQGTPKLMALDAWVAGATGGAPTDPGPMALDELVRRYLAAFGPASVKDVQQWSGLTRLGEVVEAMADELVTFTDEDGATLHDLPDAPRPDADTEAPVRLVGEFDNLLLSHHDRRRFLRDEDRPRLATLNGIQPATLLVDGSVVGWWKIERARATKKVGASATVVVEPWRRLPTGARPAIRAEAGRLLDRVAPDDRHDVRIEGR